jgi:iduronate 2-sulfatase
VPLIIRAPGVAQSSTVSEQPVSLIDLYPTLIDLCGLTTDTKKNETGHSLDGHSLVPLLRNPQAGVWSGPDAALTALYKWRMKYDPSQESYALRARDWRYIRYENGKEELYKTDDDPHEWTNVANDPSHTVQLKSLREQLAARLPSAGAVPPQPTWKPKETASAKNDAEAWKDKFFTNHPAADTDQDGNLSWPEFKAHKAKLDAAK